MYGFGPLTSILSKKNIDSLKKYTDQINKKSNSNQNIIKTLKETRNMKQDSRTQNLPPSLSLTHIYLVLIQIHYLN
jgi:hypothetical protein